MVRLTKAASSVETGAMEGDAASKAALLLASELVDDGRSLPASTNVKHAECLVSMSPHRHCRYSNNDASDKEKTKAPTLEVFGAHTDSSFIATVPVAAVAGLEVYDEAAEQWYRPEKATWQHWQHEQKATGKDPEAPTETTADGGWRGCTVASLVHCHDAGGTPAAGYMERSSSRCPPCRRYRGKGFSTQRPDSTPGKVGRDLGHC
jgi:hypothetical protein